METSTDISKKIWQEKYQFKNADGSPIDRTLEDTWKRVAKALAAVEKDSVFWERKYVEDEIRNKLDNTLFCLVKSKVVDGEKYFSFESATLLSKFNPSKLQQLFENHALYVDFDARTRHNHGTKFRIDIKSIDKLFEKSIQIF